MVREREEERGRGRERREEREEEKGRDVLLFYYRAAHSLWGKSIYEYQTVDTSADMGELARSLRSGTPSLPPSLPIPTFMIYYFLQVVRTGLVSWIPYYLQYLLL